MIIIIFNKYVPHMLYLLQTTQVRNSPLPNELYQEFPDIFCYVLRESTATMVEK